MSDDVSKNEVNCPDKRLSVAGFQVRYNSYVSAIQTYEEIFKQLHYNFVAESDTPFIIDCGANIGLATLFFKNKYPNARILCFEPDVRAFPTLESNVSENGLTDIELVNAAVAEEEGRLSFYGQMDRDDADVRANSVLQNWGMQRNHSTKSMVNAVKLSKYLNHEIDFLKLDVEGAEQQVLFELGDKLRLIKELHIEIHESDDIKQQNSVQEIKSILVERGFEICWLRESNIDIWPEPTREWVSKAHPKLYSLRAIRA